MLDIKPEILSSPCIQLQPIMEFHRDELYSIANNETIWTYCPSSASGENFHRWFDKALVDKARIAFVVRRLEDNKIVGSTSYYNINAEHHRLTIGYTWYIPEVWGTYVNPECKFLLLQFAFEKQNVNRVELMTDSRNARSRAAIKKLGAKEEGILRQHMILDDGYIRDTVMFSLIKSDWSDVKKMLQQRIEKTL